jgi:uncharacterized protein
MQNLNNQFIDQSQLADLCQKYQVAKLLLFGSVLREDFDPLQSDLDVLVEFLPGANKSLFTLINLQDKLTTILRRQVDLTTPGSLSKYFRDDVVRSAKVIYDAA